MEPGSSNSIQITKSGEQYLNSRGQELVVEVLKQPGDSNSIQITESGSSI